MNETKIVNRIKVPLTEDDYNSRQLRFENAEKNKIPSAWVALRNKRNALLVETDHYALQDVDLSDEMKIYRQALRDLPSTVDINNPVYPEQPQ